MASTSAPAPNDRLRFERAFVVALCVGAAIVALIPAIYGLLAAPAGSSYLGFQYATDDQMVYSAWMRQAMDGRLLFDNRFAIDAQPGLTFHLYFLVLGWVAKALGIIFTANLARAGFSALFIYLLWKVVRRATYDAYGTKLTLALTVLGGGIGFLAWHTFGDTLVRPESRWMAGLTSGGQPVDIWQPEAFVFPSMLTNGLFMASLCLTLGTFLCVLNCHESWRPVLPGALFFAALMNIHSYDVQIVACVLLGLLVAQVAQKSAPAKWIGRTAVIGLGAVLPALWFLHVLRVDPVFQARAATETYTSNPKMVIIGYLPLIVLGMVGLYFGDSANRTKRLAGAGLVAAIVLGFFVMAPEAGFKGYFMGMPAWIGCFALALVACFLVATANPTRNLIQAWAIIGLVLPYFPALYERKLMMGLSIPWAVLSASAIAHFVADKDRSKRNMATVLSLIVLGGTSLRWFFREIDFIRMNVTRTTVQPVYLNRDIQDILKYLNQNAAPRTVVLGMPGSWNPVVDDAGKQVPDQFSTPILPDVNPILSGFSGAYTFAGHWSETPFMDTPDPKAPMSMSRRQMAAAVFSQRTPDDVRRQILDYAQADFLFAPISAAYDGAFADLSGLGKVVAGSNQFQLIQLKKS